jgi:PAS domain S-box-containing protein
MREPDKALVYSDSLIKNVPDPVFVSDLEGRILQANDAVYELLGFCPDELLEQSLSRFISPQETREFLAALREVIESRPGEGSTFSVILPLQPTLVSAPAGLLSSAELTQKVIE